MRKEYTTIREVVGPLVMVDGVDGVKYDELVEIKRTNGGDLRRGKVLEVNGSKALVQLFEGSQGLKIADSRAKFLGHSIELAVAPDMLGRVFDGMGRPKDGGAPLIPEKAAPKSAVWRMMLSQRRPMRGPGPRVPLRRMSQP